MSNIIEEPAAELNPVTCIPKNIIKRNEYGLICNESVKYIYDETGFVDWRKMISPKFLVPNKQVFERNGKQVPKDISGLDDRELLILLGGIKELAQIRGFSKVCYDVISPSNEYVIATCSIEWIPNFETEGRDVTFTAIGDASEKNTTAFGRSYLGPIAENRAFVRSVRNFLKINIVGQDEVNLPIVGGASNPNTKMVTSALSDVMTQHGISFEIIQKKLIDEQFKDDSGKTADTYICVDDIPVDKQFELIARIKKKAAKKE
jgi:hypothetical protein